tara:strand:+ start:493 stop:1179 length:687 start_codon:yes stop_codon:yes gene_type:complete
MRNDLQRAISNSFRTSKRKVDPFTDENETYHEATTADAVPWCKEMKDLAAVMEITKPHLYKLLKNPPVNFPMTYVRILHKQLHSKLVHGFYTDASEVPLSETVALVRYAREQVEEHEQAELERDTARKAEQDWNAAKMFFGDREAINYAKVKAEADVRKVQAAHEALTKNDLAIFFKYLEKESEKESSLRQELTSTLQKQQDMIQQLLDKTKEQQQMISKLIESKKVA